MKNPAQRSANKIITTKDLTVFAGQLKTSRKRVVFTNGVFDLLHAGHVDYLERARQLGDLLVVGLNTDASARVNKGDKRPINSFRLRARVLAALACVDYIVPLRQRAPDKLIRLIRPAVLAKGADYRLKDIVGADFVQSYGGKVVRMKLLAGLSTSRLIQRIRSL